jgi:hypothetical protein
MMGRPDSCRILRPSSTLVPSRRTTSGRSRPTVHENSLHARIVEDQLEGASDAFLGGGACYVHEVRRLTAVMLDDVHGRHGEARAIHHAADVALQLHVIQVVTRGFELERVHLVLVAHILHVVVPEQGVLIERHLAIERDQAVRLGDDQRIDLHQGRVEVAERLVHRHQQAHELVHLAFLEVELEGDVAGLERAHRGRRRQRQADDLVRMLGGDFLDIHAALGRGDDSDTAGLAVDELRDIKLARDIAALLDIDLLDFLALRSGLVRHEAAAQQLVGAGHHLLHGAADFHAARLAAAAGMDLGLHDPDRAIQLFGDGLGLRRIMGDIAARHRHAIAPQQLLGLIFVNVHGLPPPGFCRCITWAQRLCAPHHFPIRCKCLGRDRLSIGQCQFTRMKCR